MKPNCKAIAAGNGIAVIYNGKPYTATADHPNFKKLKVAIQKKRYTLVLKLLNLAGNVKATVRGTGVKLDQETLKWEKSNEPVHPELSRLFTAAVKEGRDPRYLKNFLLNLRENPEEHCKNDLLAFLQHRGMPITNDGHFIAYKKVTNNFLDCYSKTFDNKPGARVEVPRASVNRNRDQCSSYGLHVGAYEYVAEHYLAGTGKIVKCLVNPRDVVAVPTDYNSMKLRVCKYTVLEEVSGPLPALKTVQESKPMSKKRVSKLSTKQAIALLEKRSISKTEIATTMQVPYSRLELILKGQLAASKPERQRLLALVNLHA